MSRLRLAMEKPSPEEEKHFGEDNAQTIRPGRSPAGATVPLPVAQAPSPRIGTISEDFVDLDFADDDDKLEEKVADFKVSSFSIPHFHLYVTLTVSQLKTSRPGLFHPDDIKTVGITPPSPGPKTAPLPSLSHRTSRPSLNPILSPGPSSGLSSSPRMHGRSLSFAGNGGPSPREEAKRVYSQPEFIKYTEDDDEDYDDIFGKPTGAGMLTHIMYLTKA